MMLGNNEQREYFRNRVLKVSDEISKLNPDTLISLDRSSRPFGYGVGQTLRRDVLHLNIGTEKISSYTDTLDDSYLDYYTSVEIGERLGKLNISELKRVFGDENVLQLLNALKNTEQAVVLDDFIATGGTKKQVDNVFRALCLPQPKFITFAELDNQLFTVTLRSPDEGTYTFPQVPWARYMTEIFGSESVSINDEYSPAENPKNRFVLPIFNQQRLDELYAEVLDTIG